MPAPKRLHTIADILGLRHVDLLAAAELLTTDKVSGHETHSDAATRVPHLHRMIDLLSSVTANALQNLIVLRAGEPEEAADLGNTMRIL